jgi:hypothetical protein
LLLGLLACACQRSSIPSAQAPLATGLPSTPAPSATPSLATSISDLRLIPTNLSGEWRLVGRLRNDSAFAAQNILLEASLIDAIGRIQARRQVSLPLQTLRTGEDAPFQAFFLDVPSAARATIRVTGYVPGMDESIPVQVYGLDAIPTSDGGLAITGRVRNPGSGPALLQGLAILLRDPASQELLGVAPQTAGATRLQPGAVEPFLAVARGFSQEALLETYVDAVPATDADSVPLLLSSLPVISWTDQGKPFVVGEVKNPTPANMTTALNVSLRSGGVLAGLADITFPVPIAPGEIRPFCIEEFAGMEERVRRAGGDAESLALEVRLDAGRTRRVTQMPASLVVRVTGYEDVGSRLILRGEVVNTTEQTMGAAILASARSTEGKVLTAANLVLGESIQPGGSASFLLTMPWPQGALPAMSEFDVRAFALPPA